MERKTANEESRTTLESKTESKTVQSIGCSVAQCPWCKGRGFDACKTYDGKTETTCTRCKGVNLTRLACTRCKGADLTKLTCTRCKGADLTRLACTRGVAFT